MGLMDGLEALGLGGLGKIKIFEEEKEEKKPEPEKKADKTIQEEDILLEKQFECSVCDRKFKQLTVRPNKVRPLGQDSILRPIYKDVEPIKYYVILCPFCGYAALSRYHGPLAKPHRQLIKDNISANFRQMPTECGSTLSYEDSFTRYKLALLNSVVRQGKNSEKAFICLKTAWLIRSWKDAVREDSLEKKKFERDVAPQEREYLHNALEGFIKAMANEQPPYAGMNEMTLNYLIGALCVELNENLTDGARVLQEVITSTSTNATDRLKDKSRDLLIEIRNLMKKNKEQ